MLCYLTEFSLLIFTSRPREKEHEQLFYCAVFAEVIVFSDVVLCWFYSQLNFVWQCQLKKTPGEDNSFKNLEVCNLENALCCFHLAPKIVQALVDIRICYCNENWHVFQRNGHY